jgi:hypothetical protein
MEILEMPAIEEADEQPRWGNPAPVQLDEQELDIEAFELWHEASRLE